MLCHGERFARPPGGSHVTATHYNNFNLIRLLAAAQVLAVHGFNHFGFEGPLVDAMKAVPGVPTFFFISGLLIYGSYDRTRDQGLRAFFRNRVLRIFPALWACVAVSALGVAATGYLATQSFSTGHFLLWLAGQSSFFQFYNPDFMRGFGVGVVNGALWTISVELQFYMLTPVLFWLLTRRRSLFALLFCASLATNLYLRLNPDWENLALKLVYVSFLPWVYMFMVGSLVANHRDLATAAQRWLRLWWLIPAYIVSMNLIGPYESNANNAINPISFVLLAGCVLRLSSVPLPLPERMARFIARQDFSYGLYLYHMPTLNLLLYMTWFSPQGNLAALFAISGLLAMMSWYVIERPALRHKR